MTRRVFHLLSTVRNSRASSNVSIFILYNHLRLDILRVGRARIPLTRIVPVDIIIDVLGNRLAVGHRTLDPAGKVRILLPQPTNGNIITIPCRVADSP